MPFQTDVFAARAPYSFEGAVKKFHLFPVKDLIAGRFRDTSVVGEGPVTPFLCGGIPLTFGGIH